MKSTSRLRMILVACSIAALVAPVLAADDVTGTWVLAVDLGGQGGEATFTLKQDGSTLTGTYSGLLGQSEVAGTVEGANVEFSFTGSGQGQEMTISYKGTVAGDEMSGTCSYGELGEGTFTGKRKASEE